MLAEPLARIRVVRPRMTMPTRAIVEAVLLSEGSIGSTEFVAHRLGLNNRFQLARMLKREGLPPLHRLAAWTAILGWVQASEQDGACLFRLAFRSHRHPSACYRLVKEITGLSWLEVRAHGAAWVERRLMAELQRANCGSRRSGDADGPLAPAEATHEGVIRQPRRDARSRGRAG